MTRQKLTTKRKCRIGMMLWNVKGLFYTLWLNWCFEFKNHWIITESSRFTFDISCEFSSCDLFKINYDRICCVLFRYFSHLLRITSHSWNRVSRKLLFVLFFYFFAVLIPIKNDTHKHQKTLIIHNEIIRWFTVAEKKKVGKYK